MDNISPTPMLRQYHELKQQHPGTLLFFRLGDFYEMFYQDAITGARELEITLTARNKEKGNAVPMCGVPHHAAAGYIARLVRKGYRVAICEQTEEAGKTKKLVRREVVRVITPGTAIDPQLLESREPVYLAAVCGSGSRYGAAFLEVSTGEFRVTQAEGNDAWARVVSDIESYAPKELLFPEAFAPLVQTAFAGPVRAALLPGAGDAQAEAEHLPSDDRFTLTPVDDWQWQLADCTSLLKEQLRVQTLAGYALEDKPEAVRAAGACLRYARDTQRAAAEHIADLTYFTAHDCLVLDAITLRNLELLESSAGDGRTRSLLGVLDSTATGMGARMLRTWLSRPAIRRGEIEARLASVAFLCAQVTRDRLHALLKEVADLERLIGRLHLGTASPRDVVALARSMKQAPLIRGLLADAEPSLLQILCENISELPELLGLIDRAIADSPPLNFGDGDVIRDGYNAELDDLRAVSRNAKQTIAGIEERERARTGITTMRVKYNNVFGYFIEVSKAAASRVPDDYERRQTLTNAERYTTPELKEWERKVLGADERIKELEIALFAEVRTAIVAETKSLQATAKAFAMLDALASLAETAVRRRYVQPVLHDGDEIEIKGGRHPLIESFIDVPFIPNDVYLNNSTDRLLIITGPNMGGKSSLLRQTAIIQILAQMGSFVPATAARLPLLDRIWTRVGASDDVSRGRSTFMVEMTEAAAILRNATPRSLILLDEVGRGTATFDGLSLAWAIAEFLHDSPGHAAKTLFATHYHELTELAERLPGAQNYQVTATERDGEVVFLHRLERGRASKSYGIEVARLAGLPPEVLTRAREVLRRLERYELDVFADEMPATVSESAEGGLGVAAKKAARRQLAAQVTLFEAVNQSLFDELRTVETDELSPDDALRLVREMKSRMI
ncbi:MAG: DNA mismatch repair protein MutS [Pyrinomonadaceae bacterium]